MQLIMKVWLDVNVLHPNPKILLWPQYYLKTNNLCVINNKNKIKTIIRVITLNFISGSKKVYICFFIFYLKVTPSNRNLQTFNTTMQ